MTREIRVAGPPPYDVLVGHGLAERLPPLLAGAARVVVVVDEQVATVAEALSSALQSAAVDHQLVSINSGEAAKSLTTVEELWDRMGQLRITRADALVAVGGGATTDVVGFVAATWLRGIRVVHVPTTLLGMVDAAIGGKTGINTRAGKNLVGAFHAPAGVLADLDTITSLPPEQWANGMAEVVKAGFIGCPEILDLVEADLAGARDGSTPHAHRLIEAAIELKARVVSEDFRESGGREALNYGHTLGHAIERVEDYAIPHGHAIAIGMVFAASLGLQAGSLDAALVARHRDVLSALGLPVRYARDAWPGLLEAMRIDKKARGDQLRFVILDGLGGTRMLEGPTDSQLSAAFEEVAA